MLLAISNSGKIGLGLLAGAFIVFAILSSFWFPRRNPNFPGNRLGLFIAITTVLFIATMAGVVVFAVEEEGAHAEPTEMHETETGEAPASTEAAPPAEGDAAAGESVFASAGCGACHTLETAGSSGAVGPNLDESQPDAELVETRVREGAGAMPAYEGQLSDEQIADVTAFVVESTQG
ncbi:MAG TPA: c-type cytochrome [Gaiellaceae bacterium]|nr:c-type cytochrome [Gaiellaceae bacterium]